MSETRTIIVLLSDGKKRRVSNIPKDAKVTFGPVQPGRNGGYDTANVLRIYTSQSNQLAVFVGVKEFRDLALDVKEYVVARKSKVKSENDGKGKSEYTEEIEEEGTWDDQD